MPNDGVDLFDIEAIVLRRRHRALDPEGAEPVGDETRCVLAVDDPLAETRVGEVTDGGERLRPRLGIGDHLEQAHVARRIEEMGDQEIPAKACGKTFCQ